MEETKEKLEKMTESERVQKGNEYLKMENLL